MKHYTLLAILAATGLTLAVPARAETQELTLSGFNGQDLGTATLEYANDGLHIKAEVKGMSVGEHGFHIHEIGDCSAEGFKSAGGHAHADGQMHGRDSEGPAHWGDLPNLTVDATGNGTIEVVAAGVTHDMIADADGSALIVHEKADDYHSQPSGDAGGRVACAIIAPAQP